MAEVDDHAWDDLRAAIGQDFDPGGHVAGNEVSEGQVRYYCEVLELDCPLHYDADVARQHGYDGIIAPVSSMTAPFAYTALWEPGQATRFPVADPGYHSVQQMLHRGPEPTPLPMPPTSAFFISGVEVDYFSPLMVGDRLEVAGRKLVDVNVRKTRVGHGAFVTTESSYSNQHGRLIAVQRYIGFHYNPSDEPSEGPAPEQSAPPATPLAERRGELEARASYVDWSYQRTFDDVNEGDEVPPVVINLTIQRLIEWAAATHQFHPIHHNTEFARGTGAPDMFANNVACQSWVERTVREYIGLDGRIKKVGPVQIRTFSVPGDAVATAGVVRRKWQEGGENLVELEMWSEHGRGFAVAPTAVIVALPSSN